MAHPYKGISQHEHGRAVAKGRVKGYEKGGAVDRKDMSAAFTEMDRQLSGREYRPSRANGGRLGMTAGSESGVGRLQKAKKY